MENHGNHGNLRPILILPAMNKNNVHIKRALISVSDKLGIIDFARGLHNLDIEIISTGGTARTLRDAGIPVKDVSELTGFPEMMDGRVKTLHPLIHGGILGLRDAHAYVAREHNVAWIDLVVCNLYPFAKTIAKPNVTDDEAIENIDIGGPSMIRSAAKNVGWVGVIIDPADYASILDELKSAGGLTYETRRRLQAKAFRHTARYDAIIAHYLTADEFPEVLTRTFDKVTDLRYGENPHQKAAVYKDEQYAGPSLLNAKIHQGKELSYNNLNDADGALNALLEFDEPTCVVVKHATPCGVASRDSITDAFRAAYDADSLSAFGGVIVLNRPCTKEIADYIVSVFAEVLLAPGFDKGVFEMLSSKPKMRVLELPPLFRQRADPPLADRGSWSGVTEKLRNFTTLSLRSISGGLLMQDADTHIISRDNLKVVTEKLPTEKLILDLLFAWKVVKHAKSNAIVLAKNKTTAGIGGGQVSRVDAVKIAIEKSGSRAGGSVLASDAFFPFRDSIDEIAKAGISAIIQPGGSIKDQEVTAACNEHDIAMVFTGVRCFRH